MTTSTSRTPQRAFLLLAMLLSVCLPVFSAAAQNPAHPEALPPLEDNPYLSYRDPWRWDRRTQLFLRPGIYFENDGYARHGYDYGEVVWSVKWQPGEIEIVFPVVRNGGFYWSPNLDVKAEIRLDDTKIGYSPLSIKSPSPPVVDKNMRIVPKYVMGNDAEYSTWQSAEITGEYRQLHMTHTSHVVCADTVFNDKLARQLPWPDTWAPRFASYLKPIVDPVGQPVPENAEKTIVQLVESWIGEGNDPRDAPQLDVVKYLTGKVIEHVTVAGQATEFPKQSMGAGARPSLFVTSNNWAGFIVRPAHIIAEDPAGSRFDLAVLLTSVLRAAGVPARTVICINKLEEDPLLNTVALVEFAMHDPERDLTFWVPIDIDRVRVTGARSSQFTRPWNYFGTHDELSHMIPLAYYFHPPANYQSFDLPLLYGIRSTSGHGLPEYMIQSLLVDPIVTPVSGHDGVAGD